MDGPALWQVTRGAVQAASFDRVTAATHRNDSSGCRTSYMIHILVDAAVVWDLIGELS